MVPQEESSRASSGQTVQEENEPFHHYPTFQSVCPQVLKGYPLNASVRRGFPEILSDNFPAASAGRPESEPVSRIFRHTWHPSSWSSSWFVRRKHLSCHLQL